VSVCLQSSGFCVVFLWALSHTNTDDGDDFKFLSSHKLSCC